VPGLYDGIKRMMQMEVSRYVRRSVEEGKASHSKEGEIDRAIAALKVES
jgi:hypothetical protein